MATPREDAGGGKRKVDRCCGCCTTGSCVRCSCVLRGKPCTSCVPSRMNKCRNTDECLTSAGSRSVNGEVHSNHSDMTHGQERSDMSRLEKAFGARLVRDGEDDNSDAWIVWWKRLVSVCSGSVYDLPGGNVGREFVGMLADEVKMVSSKIAGSERLIVFCRVVLQRNRMIKKGCDIRLLVKRRLEAWRSGNFIGLVDEAVRCARSLGSRSGAELTHEHVVKVFTRLMMKGELRAATRWITERSSGKVLSPGDVVDCNGKTVFDVLQDKHPSPNIMTSNDIVDDNDLPALMDVSVTSGHIERVARALHGGAGPSGTNSGHWRSFLLRFGTQSAKLRDAIAGLIGVMANGIIEWSLIKALMSCRLIALDKNPGVRPIGVGEVLRRLMGKVMVLCTGEDVQDECGADQLCSGLRGGIEGAVHAVREMFESNARDGYGVILVDAKNAFNSVNREMGLWNARIYWPRCCRFLFNTYRGFSSLWISGASDPLYSREGVTQGDPLSMCFYAIALLPVVRSLRSHDKWMQSWYADDSACVGRLSNIKEWFELLSERGPRYGYYPEPSKSVLVVDQRYKDEAASVFEGTGVSVVTGHRFLGGFVGDREGGVCFVEKKVEDWVSYVQKLADAAKSQPQAAYASLVKSLQCEWMYLMRVYPDCSSLFEPLKTAINEKFWPALFGGLIEDKESELFSLPTRFGGLGVRDPVWLSTCSSEASRMGCGMIIDYMQNGEAFNVEDHLHAFSESMKQNRSGQIEKYKLLLEEIMNTFDERKGRAMKRVIDGKCSGWLNVMPVASYNFDLSGQIFRDALALRYNRPIVALPASCDGCGAVTSVAHALSCRKGGLVIRRHNEVRDALGELMAMAFGNCVVREPVVREADPENDVEGLVADLATRGLWQSQSEALLDIRVIDTDAASYCHRPVCAVIKSAEEEKKRKYNEAVEARRGSFSPFVLSVDGYVGVEAGCVLRRIAEVLSRKWEKNYGQVMDWVRCTMSFAVIRATGLCLRGSRVPWRSGRGFDDGVGLPTCAND